MKPAKLLRREEVDRGQSKPNRDFFVKVEERITATLWKENSPCRCYKRRDRVVGVGNSQMAPGRSSSRFMHMSAKGVVRRRFQSNECWCLSARFVVTAG